MNESLRNWMGVIVFAGVDTFLSLDSRAAKVEE